jgi:hypothetical protein
MHAYHYLLFLTFLAPSIMHTLNIPRGAAQTISVDTSFSQPITSSQLNSSSTAINGQFVISKSGRYVVSTNLYAAPGRSNLAIIYINTSDVTLDLGGKSLCLSTSNNTPSIAAIKLADGIQNVTIMNGVIHGSGSGPRQIATGITGSNNINTFFDNLDIVSCSSTGISLTGAYGLSINNTQVYKTPTGLSLSNCQAGFITDGLFSGGNASTTVGIAATSCSNFILTNINTSNDTATSGIAYGIKATSCSSFELNNINISNNKAAAASCYGLFMSGCTGFICKEIIASCNQITSSALISGAAVAGFFLTAAANNTFINCSSNANGTTTALCPSYGFRLEAGSNGNTFNQCEAKGNIGATTSGVSAGFSNNASNYNNFLHCTAINNAAGAAYGFYSTGASNGTAIKNCRANGNNSTTNWAYGFVFDGETGGVILNCECNINTGIYTCGIALLSTSAACISNSIGYNKLFFNNGSTAEYGFYDAAANSTTFLHGNVAFGHGKYFTGSSAIAATAASANYRLVYSKGTNLSNLIKETPLANMSALEADNKTYLNLSIY